jgi:hypothetical protein
MFETEHGPCRYGASVQTKDKTQLNAGKPVSSKPHIPYGMLTP